LLVAVVVATVQVAQVPIAAVVVLVAIEHLFQVLHLVVVQVPKVFQR
jgi:hypothetical protein